MKRVLTIFLSLLVVFGVFSCTVTVNAEDSALQEEEGQDGRVYNNMFEFDYTEEGNIKILKYVGSNNKSVVLPEQFRFVEGREERYCTVTEVASGAFKNKTDVANIALPDTITTIGESAFKGCSNLTTVTLPNNENFNVIETGLFNGCISLTRIVVPESVTTIKNN